MTKSEINGMERLSNVISNYDKIRNEIFEYLCKRGVVMDSDIMRAIEGKMVYQVAETMVELKIWSRGGLKWVASFFSNNCILA